MFVSSFYKCSFDYLEVSQGKERCAVLNTTWESSQLEKVYWVSLQRIISIFKNSLSNTTRWYKLYMAPQSTQLLHYLLPGVLPCPQQAQSRLGSSVQVWNGFKVKQHWGLWVLPCYLVLEKEELEGLSSKAFALGMARVREGIGKCKSNRSWDSRLCSGDSAVLVSGEKLVGKAQMHGCDGNQHQARACQQGQGDAWQVSLGCSLSLSLPLVSRDSNEKFTAIYSCCRASGQLSTSWVCHIQLLTSWPYFRH